MTRHKRKVAAPARETAVPPADDAVRREWLRRVEAEYRSGAHAQHLTLWLMQLGAPPDLLELGLNVVRDELSHAELSEQVYRAAGGTGAPELSRESLGLARHATEPLELDVLRTGVEMFCLGETIAVRLFTRLREGCTVPVARRALDRILRDEVGHRDFGWTLLGAEALERSARSLSPATRAWGVMPVSEYLEAVDETFRRDYAPRVRALELCWPEQA